jgi:hypothetical protein
LLAAVCGALSCLPPDGSAQEPPPIPNDAAFIPRTSPYPAHYISEPREYNLKWGNVTARLAGSVQMEYNDNINLSEIDPQQDFIFGPNAGVGFVWPISENNVLQFDIGVGYRAYVNHPELNSVQIQPDSRLSYQIRVLKAQVLFYDQFRVDVDPISRPELSGGRALINYQRFNNALGMTVNWEAIRKVTFVGGYEWVLDQSLNGEFTELDRQDHVFHLSAYRPLGARVTGGLTTSYTLTEYDRPIQNDGHTFSAGPRVSIRLTDFINADAGLAYTSSHYDQTGTIRDQSSYDGLTFGGGLNHRMNSRVTQYVRASKSLSPGFNSNFTDIWSLQYGVSWRVASAVTLNGTFVYENLTSSLALAEDSNRYLWYLGTRLRVARRWTAGISYSYALKDSRLPDRDYSQNRVTLDLTRHF